MFQCMSSVAEHGVIAAAQYVRVAVSGIDTESFFRQSNRAAIVFRCLASPSWRPVVGSGQISASDVVLAGGSAGVLVSSHRIIKMMNVKIRDAKIGVGA